MPTIIINPHEHDALAKLSFDINRLILFFGKSFCGTLTDNNINIVANAFIDHMKSLGFTSEFLIQHGPKHFHRTAAEIDIAHMHFVFDKPIENLPAVKNILNAIQKAQRANSLERDRFYRYARVGQLFSRGIGCVEKMLTNPKELYAIAKKAFSQEENHSVSSVLEGETSCLFSSKNDSRILVEQLSCSEIVQNLPSRKDLLEVDRSVIKLGMLLLDNVVPIACVVLVLISLYQLSREKKSSATATAAEMDMPQLPRVQPQVEQKSVFGRAMDRITTLGTVGKLTAGVGIVAGAATGGLSAAALYGLWGLAGGTAVDKFSLFYSQRRTTTEEGIRFIPRI